MIRVDSGNAHARHSAVLRTRLLDKFAGARTLISANRPGKRLHVLNGFPPRDVAVTSVSSLFDHAYGDRARVMGKLSVWTCCSGRFFARLVVLRIFVSWRVSL